MKYIKERLIIGLIIAAILALFLGCSKKNDNKVCWECHIVCPGANERDEIICLDPWETPSTFRDANNNDCLGRCQRQ